VTCDEIRAAISAALDGEPDTFDADHLAVCSECARFEREARRLRSVLRFELLAGAPDVSDRVVAELPDAPRDGHSRGRRLLPAAAAFAVGLVAGAAFVWPIAPDDGIAAAGLPSRVVAAQREVASLVASITVTERSPARHRIGTLRYRAPDTLELRLGDAALVAGGDRWLLRGADGTVVARSGVEPFDAGDPLPLDLVLPAAGFIGADEPVSLGRDVIDGREALGVRVPAAQVGALLSGLRPGGEGRDVHATDLVDLWLDDQYLVPLRLAVRAADGPDRARWAAARGHAERPGDVIVEMRLDGVVINDARTVDDLGPPAVDGAIDYGFRPSPSAVPIPAWLPRGMTAHMTGTLGDVAVGTWTDGRAWLKVRATTSWTGKRLFGGLGSVVRELVLGDGIAYAAEDGGAVAIHGDGIDVVVSGSVAPADLLRVASSLGIEGRSVPLGWAERYTASIGDLAQALPGHLVLPGERWPGEPAVRLDERTAVLVYAGPGDRAVVLASRADRTLSPPFDPDATGVVVRGGVGRWSPSRGELEWVERGRLWTLRSATVGLAELVDLAGALEPRP